MWEIDAVGTFNGFTAVRLNSRNETFNIGKGHKCRDQRWVHIKDDKDFEAIAHAVCN